MDDYQIKNDKRRLMITSVVIILVLLAVGFGVFELFTYAYEQTMKDRMQDEVYRYENQISAQIDQDFQMMNTMAAFLVVLSLYKMNSILTFFKELMMKMIFDIRSF